MNPYEALHLEMRQSIETKSREITKLMAERETLLDCASRLNTIIDAEARERQKGL